MQWTSVLLLIAPVALLVMAWGGPLARRIAAGPAAGGTAGQRPALRQIIFIYLISGAAPLLFAIFWRNDATRIVIELRAIAFRSEGGGVIRKAVHEKRKGSGRIVIGDAVRTKSTQRFGTLVYRGGMLSVELPEPSQRSGLIASAGDGLLGAAIVEDNDRVCVAGACWTYDAKKRALASGKNVAEIPRRQAEIPGVGWRFPLPFAKPATAPLRTWSVDWLAHESGAIGSDQRLRSFLAWSDRGLTLMPLDREVSLVRGGKAIQIPATYEIQDGQRLRFYTLPAASGRFAAGGIAERRSVVHHAGRRSFQLDLDTPEIHALSAEELKVLETAVENRKRVALSMGDAQLVDRSLYFDGLSESVAVQANAVFDLAREFPGQSLFRIVTPRGPVESAIGKVAWIGSTDLAAVRLDVVRPPFLLLLIGLALLLLKAVSAWAIELDLTQALMAGTIEILVGMRLLLGYRVWAMPPHKLEAVELALVAWMALPWIFLAASLPKLRSRAAFPALAGLLLSAVFCFQVVDGPTKWVWLAAHALPLIVVVGRPTTSYDVLGRLRMDPIVLAAIAFTVVRAILLLFGFKESASLGARVSLSVLHIPAAAILEGIFLWRAWNHVKAHGKLTKQDLIAAAAILVFVWAIPAAITSDVGLALLNGPAFLLLLLALTRHAEAKRASWLSRALATVMVLFLAGAPLLRLALPLLGNEERLLSFASDSNYARFLHFAAPERLQEMATKRGESLAVTSAILQSYISSGFFGRGYGHTDVSPHLGDTALRDFAPAVFVAAEWGLVGTVATLLTYLLFSVIARAWLPWRDESPSPAPSIAAVAAVTITVSSIYMILANHELLLLTGKNAYLLGLDSAGDVMEFLVLIVLMGPIGRIGPIRPIRPMGGPSL